MIESVDNFEKTWFRNVTECSESTILQFPRVSRMIRKASAENQSVSKKMWFISISIFRIARLWFSKADAAKENQNGALTFAKSIFSVQQPEYMSAPWSVSFALVADSTESNVVIEGLQLRIYRHCSSRSLATDENYPRRRKYSRIPSAKRISIGSAHTVCKRKYEAYRLAAGSNFEFRAGCTV